MNKEDVLKAYEKLGEKDKEIVIEFCNFLISRNNDGWVTVREAAIRLGVSPTTMRRWVDGGIVRSRNMGERKTLVSVEDIDSIKERRRSEA
jgi:excisionase family DNA binding protein